MVAQCFVYGDSHENCLIAVAVPDQEALMHYYKEKYSGQHQTYEEILQLPDINKLILSNLNDIARDNHLNRLEFIQAVYLESQPFTMEQGLLTPSFKLRRAPLKDRYQTIFNNMYTQL